MATRDRLLSSLRFALRHLYDSTALARSPLIESLRLSSSLDPASDLRRVLTRTIRSLQPPADMPADTEAWRVYEVLLYRYIQRCSQLEVADQLGLSERHLRREERKALQVLAGEVRRCFEIDGSRDEEPPQPEERDASPIKAELAWLEASSPQEPVALDGALSAALDLARPLAARHGVSLEMRCCPDSISLAVHPVALRQVLLSLLGAAIRQSPRQPVVVCTRLLDCQAEVQVQASKGAPEEDGDTVGGDGVAGSIDIARRLVEACGGGLTVRSDANSFVANVVLPALEQVPVLLIDDNAHTLQLLQRYVSATRYRIYPAHNLPEALSLAAEARPQIIVLDVMMPDMDGWEVLGHLRQHPLTSHAPIIVCTILAEEELALSLGADGFVRKPVSREVFLKALDHQACPAEPGSR